MKRILCIAGAVLLLITGAAAQAVPQANPLCGEAYYPQGSTADTASFVLRYKLPQFTQEQPQYEAVNAWFTSYGASVQTVLLPDILGTLDAMPSAEEPAYYTDLDYRITASNAEHLSILLVSQQFLGNTLLESWSARVFALDGIYAGQPLSLSQAMGLEQAADDSSADTASELVYGLVWQIVEYEIGAMQKAYFPDCTEDDLRRAFAPQTDFYFDEDGNFVFFVQAGAIAGEVEGVLTYPFSLAELLSAVRQN